MSFVESRDGVQLHVKDMGKGRPVVLIHGWPLTGDMFEYQSLALLEAGYWVITYDRRGFGQSGHPFDGYDYDTFADDLAAILDKLDIRSKSGGLLHGRRRSRPLLVAARDQPGGQGRSDQLGRPISLKDTGNPDGVDQSVFDDMKKQIRKDRFGFYKPSARCSTGSALSAVP